LTKPCALNAQENPTSEEEMLADLQAKDANSEEVQKVEGELIQRLQEKQAAKQKGMYESFLKIIESEKQADYMLPHNKKD
jgi:hypothetical protein